MDAADVSLAIVVPTGSRRDTSAGRHNQISISPPRMSRMQTHSAGASRGAPKAAGRAMMQQVCTQLFLF